MMLEFGNLTRPPVRPYVPTYVPTYVLTQRSCHCVEACGAAEPLLSGLMMMPMIRYLPGSRVHYLDN